ncbi:MAG: metallophosphoesterase, partial [Actinobacteria bacterium]|nr:metallophosphoesterase [Actinomycetota bacterium]
MYWWIPALTGGLTVIVLLFLYLFRFEPVNFKLSNICIDIDPGTGTGPDKKHNGKVPILTVLHLSDFHLRKGFKGSRLFDFVRSLAVREYDLIFITGDMVDNLHNVDYLTSMLGPLKAKYGKFAVLGVHDHYNKA